MQAHAHFSTKPVLSTVGSLPLQKLLFGWLFVTAACSHAGLRRGSNRAKPIKLADNWKINMQGAVF